MRRPEEQAPAPQVRRGRRSKRSDEHRRLIKQVPDTYSERKLSDSDGTLDREATDAVLDEINERAVEAALQLKEANDGSEVDGRLTMGPTGPPTRSARPCRWARTPRCTCRTRRSHGSCAVQTAKALAKAIGTVEGWNLIVAGERGLGRRRSARCRRWSPTCWACPALTHAVELTVDGSTATAKRETDDGVTHLSAELPAVVSIGEKANEPRYPSFKGIMAAKKKPVETLDLADAGIDASEVGLANALTTVTSAAPKPPKSAGEKVTDEGDGGAKIAAYLVGQKLI